MRKLAVFALILASSLLSEGIWKFRQPVKPRTPLFVKLGNIGASALNVGA